MKLLLHAEYRDEKEYLALLFYIRFDVTP